MGVVAVALKHLMEAGLSGERLLSAIAEIEDSCQFRRDESAERRREKDKERKRAYRVGLKGDASADVSAESADSADGADLDKEGFPQTPIQEIKHIPPLKGPPKNSADVAADGWNGLAAECGLAKISKLTPRRRRAVDARLREVGPNGWAEALAKVRNSPFCLGENDRGWRVDFDFIASEAGFLKITEGKFDKGTGPPRHLSVVGGDGW